jgi:hypothetical protein
LKRSISIRHKKSLSRGNNQKAFETFFQSRGDWTSYPIKYISGSADIYYCNPRWNF